MIFDTDIFIWAQRGNAKALRLMQSENTRQLSMQTALELLQGARNAEEQKQGRHFLAQFHFTVLPLTEAIGHRALIYVEQYGLSHGLRAGDAIIAATAVENALPLASGNGKHFRAIKDLDLRVFKP
jgi:predicted nucleic acid-binding protein